MFVRMPNFTRKRLRHGTPEWIKDGEIYFITINCKRRNVNVLTDSDTASAIKESVQHYTDAQKWWPRFFVLMPDHLHALLSLNTGRYLIPQIISSWKRYLKRTERIEWQEGFFEHRIRNQDSLAEKANYLCQNPVRANLAKNPKDWPYTWHESDFQR